MATANRLVEKIQSLTPDQVSEVEEFVESLQSARQLAGHASLSEPVFESIWNNPEDDIYDAA